MKRSQFEEVRGARRIFASSPGVRRGFCGTCGTSLTYEGDAWPGEIHIYTATLDDAAAFPPTVHTYTVDRIAWFDFDDGLPRRTGFGSD
ncbi:MAG: GFA family protein [Proteobacteria bacterium]|nr:GFA family protein [Pseudomonadota bacterium]